MKLLTTFLGLTFILSSASAQTIEALRLSADAALGRALPLAVHPDLLVPHTAVLQNPLVPRPATIETLPQAAQARVALPGLLEANRRIMTLTLGARTLDVGMASDASFSKNYLTFSDDKTTSLAALGDMSRLRGSGINARIDAKTIYKVKVLADIFNPVRGSTLRMTPINGTAGPAHAIKTGAVLDAVRARAFVFKAFRLELWLFYGADVLPDGSGFAGDRSFLFIMEDGLSSKAWPLAESALTADVPAVVDLNGNRLKLTRTAGGELIISEAR